MEGMRWAVLIISVQFGRIQQEIESVINLSMVNCMRCRFRNEDNGNCTAFGGFCTAVPAAHCPLLHDYLDVGLMPNQVANAKVIIESAFADDTYKAERIKELLKADAEGRLVVLPCRVGDGLWTFCTHPVEQVYSFTVTDISTLNGRTMLNTSRCGVIDARDVGKTVFLTREEAESELEAMKDG